MQLFKNILAVVDASEKEQPLIELAIQLARANEAQLRIVDVVPALNWTQRILLEHADHVEQLLVREKSEQFKAIVSRIRQQGITAKSHVLLGQSSVEIVRQVLRNKHDLVLKAAKGSHSRRQGFLGTTAIELLKNCPCAVWLATPGSVVWPARVLAAVDATPDDADHAELNLRLLEAAHAVATLGTARLDVVHVWSVLGERFIRDYMKRNDFREIEQALQKDSSENLACLVRTIGLAGDSDQVHLLRGEPTTEIPLFVRDNHIDLLIMGTVARRGISGMLIGNTADIIVNQIQCSILAVKPEGFVSPIKSRGRKRMTVKG